MDYRIEKLCEKHFAAAVEVIRLSFFTVAQEFFLTPHNCPGNGAFMTQEKLETLKQRGAAMFGLTVASKLAGFIAVKRKGLTETWYLEKTAVLPDYRHRGYGGALLLHACEYIASKGGENISIGIIADNIRLRLWYERYGFVATESRAYPSLPFTVTHLEKKL